MKDKNIYPSVSSTTERQLHQHRLLLQELLPLLPQKTDASSSSAYNLANAKLNSRNSRFWLSVTFPNMSITSYILDVLNRIEIVGCSSI
jgi:hypothetical protein